MPSQQDTIIRQLDMLRLIRREPAKITARSIHDKLRLHGFDVDKRTIERDLRDLSRVFPLIADVRERPYGWSWKKGAPSLDIPRLTPDEALALKLLEQYLKGLLPLSVVDHLRPHFDAASHVLEGERKANKTSAWLKKIAVVQPTQPLLPPKQDPKIQRVVYDAVLRERQLMIRYQKPANEAAEDGIAAPLPDQRIHPLGLVQRGAVTYVVVRFDKYEKPRTLALHRIKAVAILDEPAKAPEGFSLQDYIDKGAFGFGGSGKMVKLVLRMDKAAAKHLYETPLATDQTIEPDGAKHVIVRATVQDNEQLNWWILGFDKQARRLQ